MLLKHKVLKVVEPGSPFNFDATFHKPAHFPSGDNLWEPGARWQTFLFQGKCLGVVFHNAGSVTKPEVIVEIYSQEPLDSRFVDDLLSETRYRYNLDLDLRDFYKQFSCDKLLSPVIKRMYGLRPGHQDSLYEYLVIGVVLQNCTVRRSISMMQTLFEHYGTQLEFAGKKLWCFWEQGRFNNVSEEELRSLKIGYRAKFIKRIDAEFAVGKINEIELRSKDFETQKKALLSLYGVGPATVWYLLFDIFHQSDFFDHISPWEQKIYSKAFFNREIEKPLSTKKLINFFNRYGKYRQLAVHYLWEDLWWRHKKKPILWLQKEVRQ